MYVGNVSRQQNYYQDINLPDPSFLPGLVNGTIAGGRNAVAKYPGFGQIRQSTDGGNAKYNGLQLDLNSQIKRDLALRVFYTLSRGYDSSTGGNGGGDLANASNPYGGWQYDWGPSGYDRLHNFSANFFYDLPFLRHASNAVVRTVAGGWEVSGIVTIQSGRPFNVTLQGSQSGNGIGGTNRPDVAGHISTPHTWQHWVDVASFSQPAVGAWGNAPYNVVRGPGFNMWNLSLFKNFVFSEARGSQFELRLETYNTFNHPTPTGLDLGWTPGSTSFGSVNGYFPARIIQLGGKVSF